MLKKLVLILGLSSLLFGAYDVKPEQISKTVYKFVGAIAAPSKENGGNMVNTYWVKGDTSWIVIDTGPSYNYAKACHEQMKKIANLPVKFVINTHEHNDHWLGNNYYKEHGAKLFGTKSQSKVYPAGSHPHMLSVISKEDAKGTHVVALDNHIVKSSVENIDGRDLEFMHFDYKIHTPEDFMVYLQDEKVLFSGDLLFSQRITSIRDGSVEGGLESLDFIDGLDVKVFAIGHGKHTDNTAVKQMRKYFLALKEASLKAIEDGQDVNEFVKTANFKEFEHMGLFKELHKSNLGFAFTEYEFF